jgi:glyoxylase-like metal-dependent hydrolase (beta-lactamase superfamily II)
MPVSRREFLALSSAALAALPLRSVTWAQTPAPPVTNFLNVRRNVGVFTGRGGTIGWWIDKDAVVAVDSQFPDTAKICVDGLKQRAGGRGFDRLLITHHHADHTGGNSVFRPETKKIIAHANVPGLQKKAAADAQPPTTDQQVYPDAVFDKAWSEHFRDETITARHYGPGHTGGDAIIHFEKAHVVHMGDLLFYERHPFIDRPAGASIQNWVVSVRTIAKEMPRDTIYIAGHSKEGLPVLVDRAAILKQGDYLEAVLAQVRKGRSAGQSKEEISKLETLPGFESYQSSPPRLTLGFVLGVAYDELSAT